MSKIQISKKLVAFMLAGTCSFSLVGCNKDNKKSTKNTEKLSYAVTDSSTFCDAKISVIENGNNSLFVPGFTLVIKNSNGEVVDTWVSGFEPHKVKGLEPGKYSLMATMAADGYICDYESIDFEIIPGVNDTAIFMETKSLEKVKGRK